MKRYPWRDLTQKKRCEASQSEESSNFVIYLHEITLFFFLQGRQRKKTVKDIKRLVNPRQKKFPTFIFFCRKLCEKFDKGRFDWN